MAGGDGDPAGSGAYTSPGTVYAVAGTAGQVGGGSLDHPAMVVSLASLGSVVLDVDGGRLDGVFLDDAGVVQDGFEIVHPAVFADGFESGTTGAWTATIP